MSTHRLMRNFLYLSVMVAFFVSACSNNSGDAAASKTDTTKTDTTGKDYNPAQPGANNALY